MTGLCHRKAAGVQLIFFYFVYRILRLFSDESPSSFIIITHSTTFLVQQKRVAAENIRRRPEICELKPDVFISRYYNIRSSRMVYHTNLQYALISTLVL